MRFRDLKIGKKLGSISLISVALIVGIIFLSYQQGVKSESIEVCLVGAGNVLQKEDDTICQANIESVTGILKEKNIPVRASALGGTERKSVFLDVDGGCISYKEGDKEEKRLWQAGQLD